MWVYRNILYLLYTGRIYHGGGQLTLMQTWLVPTCLRFHNHHPLIGSQTAFEIKKIKKLCLKFVLIGGEGEFRVWEFFNNSQGYKRKSHSKQIPLSIIDVCLVWVLRNFDLMFWGKTRSEWNFSIVIEFFDGDD